MTSGRRQILSACIVCSLSPFKANHEIISAEEVLTCNAALRVLETSFISEPFCQFDRESGIGVDAMALALDKRRSEVIYRVIIQVDSCYGLY